MEEISLAEYQALQRKPSKYGNVPTEAHGFIFDSKAEARRYEELRLLAHGGAIRDLVIHPTYELLPAFRRDGKSYPRTVYEADFAYQENGRTVVEDVKGKRTDVFAIKEKLFRFHYPHHDLRIIKV